MAASIVITGLCVTVGAAMGAMMGNGRSCADGACPFTANPKRGALWGGFLGLLIGLSLLPSGATLASSAANDGKARTQAEAACTTCPPFRPAAEKPAPEPGSAY